MPDETRQQLPVTAGQERPDQRLLAEVSREVVPDIPDFLFREARLQLRQQAAARLADNAVDHGHAGLEIAALGARDEGAAEDLDEVGYRQKPDGNGKILAAGTGSGREPGDGGTAGPPALGRDVLQKIDVLADAVEANGERAALPFDDRGDELRLARPAWSDEGDTGALAHGAGQGVRRRFGAIDLM